MKVYLPSNGMMGISHIDLSQPKINDLRNVPNLSGFSTIRKTEFVKMLADPDEVDKITPFDRDYLFLIAAASISMNNINFEVTCKKGHLVSGAFNIGEIEPVRLRAGESRTFAKRIFGNDYLFTKLSVKDEIEIEDRAIDLPDDQYDEAVEDGTVAVTLFGKLTDENIKKARNLDLSIYYSALLYQQSLPHGAVMVKEIQCHCGQKIIANLPITGDILNVNVAGLISNYVSVHKFTDMQSFFDLTLVEYNTFVQALNAKKGR